MYPRSGFEVIIGIVFLLIAFVVLLRVATTPAPLYANDEYAYLKHGRDLGRVTATQQIQRDPGLQDISNQAYFWVVRLAGRISGDPTSPIRVLNFGCYFIGLPLLGGWILRRHSKKSAPLWFLGLLALLPASVYILSPMPEILFATGYTFIAVVTVMMIPAAPLASCLLAGAALGILVYIKPHAVAAIAGFSAFFLVHSVINWKRGEWSQRLSPITFVAGLGIGIFFVNAAILKQTSFAPRFVGNFYTETVQSAFSLTHFVQAAETTARFALLHSLVLIMLFPLAFAGCMQAAVRLIRHRKGATSDVFDDLAFLTMLCAGAFIVMTAQYTYHAIYHSGVSNEFQANRLHGRYLIVIFPSLLLITCHVLSMLQRQPEAPLSRYLRNRWVIGTFALTAVVISWVLCHAKLFPWDYPELFSLYSNPNSYWGWVAPINLRWPVLAVGFIVVFACLIRPRLTPILLGLAQAGLFAASLFVTTFWQETHARENAPLAATGRILRTEVGPDAEDLLLVGSYRGEVSYTLCGLLGNPWVRIAALDSELTPSLIPHGTRFIATLGSYNVKFPFVSYSERGPLRIYGLEASTVRSYSVSAPLWDRKQFVTHLGGSQKNVALFGFNQPELEDAWTADDDAIVLLPYRIYGSLHMKFRSWVAGKERGDVVLVLGKSTLRFHAGAMPADFDLPVFIESPTDRIQVHFPATRSKPWDRKTGVALSEIAISPEP